MSAFTSNSASGIQSFNNENPSMNYGIYVVRVHLLMFIEIHQYYIMRIFFIPSGLKYYDV